MLPQGLQKIVSTFPLSTRTTSSFLSSDVGKSRGEMPVVDRGSRQFLPCILPEPLLLGGQLTLPPFGCVPILAIDCKMDC